MSGFYTGPNPPDLAFISMDNVDAAGHAFSWGSTEYFNALAESDAHIGIILDGVESAGLTDETLVLMTADHGGLNRFHGRMTQLELFIPFIASGPGLPVSGNATINSYVSNRDLGKKQTLV
jgi:predicted AlkP superfamily pyrophosphatase or phosphodiesterase